ncbi:FKBP-type peptidyl-prolyl cis-trans isomerase [candidate division WOR-3 bacterium]|nr:FKBP-type peptidyl-prolyl cis-trans isomerase [candidate division WOR-3 bacterium]
MDSLKAESGVNKRGLYKGVKMSRQEKRVLSITVTIAALIIVLSGCAITGSGPARVVKPGDQVMLNYTCCLKNGEIVTTTDKGVAKNQSLPKASIFREKLHYKALGLVAGRETGCQDCPEEIHKGFEEDIAARLAEAIVDLRVGESRTVEITAAVPPGMKKDEQFIQMARVRNFPREMRMAKDIYAAQTGKQPEAGQEVNFNPAIPGKVTSVIGDEVVVQFKIKPGAGRDTFFGKETARDMGDHFEIVIDAREGHLVRSGPLVGKIIDVDERLFTLDYGHPFGGEALVCDITVESAQTPVITAPSSKKGETRVAQEKSQAAVEEAARAGKTVAEIDFDKNRDRVQKGDLARVNYTARCFSDDKVFRTTLAEVAGDPDIKKAAWYEEPESFSPEDILAGEKASMPGLGEAVLGMSAGEKRMITLTPEKAYGPPDPRKMMKLPTIKRMSEVISMSAQEYVQKFRFLPVVGKEVNLVPYFKTRVIEITERRVTLEHLAKDGEQVQESFGTTEIHSDGKEIFIKLVPRIGAPFEVKGRKGRIISTDGSAFTVDFNNPLAGKTIVIDLKVVSITRASVFQTMEIPWLEDHDAGLAAALTDGKPVVLVLHAEWCGWCKRLLNEVMDDPRIKSLNDRFVWVKINSDVELEYKDLYEQKGFPLIVLLSPEGEIIKKLDGFRDAATLKRELDNII